MQPPKETENFILNEAGQFATLDTDGNVVFTGVPTPLTDDPDGWQEEQTSYVRNTLFYGIIRGLTANFSFKKTAAKILRSIYNTRGIQSFARFVILRRNNLNGYDGIYDGNVDFSRKKDTEFGFDVPVIEGGLIEIIKANQTKTYELPLNVPEAITVVDDGVKMFSELSLTNIRDYQLGGLSGNEIVPINRDGKYIHLALINNIGETSYPSLLFSGFTTYLQTDDYNDIKNAWETNWDFRATAVTTVHFFNSIRFEHLGPLNFSLKIHIYNESDGSRRDIFLTDQWINGRAYFDVTFDLIAGDKCWFMFVNPDKGVYTFFRPSPDLNTQVDPTDIINMSYTYRKEPTMVKVLPPWYVFDQLIKKMSNGIYGAKSELLQNDEGQYYCLTSGNGIRGFSDATVATSLEDLFISMNTRFNIGASVENAAMYMERKKDRYYMDENLVDLGDVAECEFDPYTENIPSAINIGWPVDSIEDVNGRQTFNCMVEWGTPVTKQEKTLDLVGRYMTDCFLAEHIRINLEGKTTTDDDTDDKVFIFNIAPLIFNGNVAFQTISGEYQIYTAGRFQSVFAGSTIVIVGSALNNGTFTVTRVSQFANNTAIYVQQAVLDEVAPVTITSNQAALNRPIYEDVQGLLSPETVFNMELRPLRCLYEHGNWIKSVLNKLEDLPLTCQHIDKNRNLVVTDAGMVMAEAANQLIGDLPGDKLFLPEVATAKVNVPLFASTLIEAGPYGQIKITWKGVAWWGFILDASEQLTMSEARVYKLLLSTRNDLSKLITE